MAVPVVAPSVPTYATYTSYITPEEFQFAPNGVDVTQLIPGGSPEDNAVALSQVIARASSEADRICQKTLAATVDVEAGRYRIGRDGFVRVPVPYAPLIQVNDVSVGAGPGQLTPLADLSNIEFEAGTVAAIPLSSGFNPGLPPTFAGARDGRLYVQVTYINGYACTLTAGTTAPGATSITVVSALGIVPGLALTLYDGAASEPVIVDGSYQLGSTTVPLRAPLANAHAEGVSVSALAPWVKQALIDLTSSMIKLRGAEAFAMSSIDQQPAQTQPSTPGGVEEQARAEIALRSLGRVK